MAKLIHKNKIILAEMKYASNLFAIARGLMFASKKRVDKGICLVIPTSKDKKFGASVTMLFCFYSYEILFVNSDNKVVDKVVLRPFRFSYIPKAVCKYVIESSVGKFKNVKIGDKIKIIR